MLFAEKAKFTPGLSWEKFTRQWKLALLAKEDIHLETLLNGPTEGVDYTQEPTYEEHKQHLTQATKCDCILRNQQLKIKWQNRCEKVEENWVLIGDNPWEIGNQKNISLP